MNEGEKMNQESEVSFIYHQYEMKHPKDAKAFKTEIEFLVAKKDKRIKELMKRVDDLEVLLEHEKKMRAYNYSTVCSLKAELKTYDNNVVDVFEGKSRLNVLKDGYVVGNWKKIGFELWDDHTKLKENHTYRVTIQEIT